MTVRHFVSDLDVTAQEQTRTLDLADAMKRAPEDFRSSLSGKILGMIFTKSSTRTRVSFEAGIVQLGGHGIFLSSTATQMGRGEPVKDTARVLSRYADLLMIRTFAHEDVRELAEYSRVPVINGLDDLYHPCQVLADLMTIRERRGELAGQQFVFVGDGNNMAHSLMLGGALSGMRVRIITPEGWEPDLEITERARVVAEEHGGRVEISSRLADVEGADVVYTDVWASMGQEEEADKRKKAFARYQVNAAVMKSAKSDAIFLHCLPAHRGEEVSEEVLEGPQSAVFDQAENRLHAQKALMAFLMGRARGPEG